MKWTEITGVDKNVDFKIKSLSGIYRIVEQPTGFQRVVFVLSTGELTGVSEWVYDEIIHAAPSGIIHLPPPLTDEQREQFKAIWTLGGRWLTKDKSGEVVTFSCKPEKNSYLAIWLPPNVMEMKCTLRHMYGLDVCSLVSWSDHEPYDIGKALGVKNE